VRAHDGDVRTTLVTMLKDLGVQPDITTVVTGNEGRKQVAAHGVIEAMAIQEVLVRDNLACRAVVALGGEDLVVYVIDADGRVINSFSGNKCASGTGEFFKQQLKRMDLDIPEGIRLAEGAQVHKLSSRCSVFMKSDCTHKLNKGEAAKGDIVLSLSNVMAVKVMEFLKKAKIQSGFVLLTGGLTQNSHLIKFLREGMPRVEFIIPESAPYFEAYGAAIIAGRDGTPLPPFDEVFVHEKVSFERMPSLTPFHDKVTYMAPRHGEVEAGREYILGIDGGSTTTKVALIDKERELIVASHYGRTHGDPVKALKKCIEEVKAQVFAKIGDSPIHITLAATTGSSREILGVFMQTQGVYNEIIAHTVGTTYFDKSIDTIFEIGGQDAKYVYLKNNVPVDYAMNEACSAGTGSFLEESAHGDLNIHQAAEIGPIAEKAEAPLRFGEHCSAFINSDIRKAIQEGASRENIVAGLVYSIVHNYLNRVVGNRSIGNRVVLQGGVAKNSGIPLAFAALVNKPIVVPPDPELMGCFGVGILAKQKHADGLLDAGDFSFNAILAAEIVYEGEFVCKSCDNYCPIRKLRVADSRYFFGGRCNKYANSRKKVQVDEAKVEDLIAVRHTMLFSEFAPDLSKVVPKKDLVVGIPQAFSVYNLWPLYATFFAELGVKTILSETPDKDGLDKMNAPFCYPGEIAHAMTEELYKKNVDYYFLPHFKFMETMQDDAHACLCPIVQGFPYYIRTAFQIPDEKILRPVIDFAHGFDKGGKPFIETAQKLGFSAKEGRHAFRKGVVAYLKYLKKANEIGKSAMERYEAEGRRAIVVFGRPYNAFTHYTNMGIPRKFTSRGFTVIPFDFVPLENADIYENMYWYYGQQNMRAAENIAKYKSLYQCYLSNFSCAPDSFILHYMRWINGTKPFLVLELDSHTADAGVDTRIEAFLDIIDGYARSAMFKPGTVFDRRYDIKIADKNIKIEDLQTGKKIDLLDKRVVLLLPSMGSESTEAIATIANRCGVNAVPLPVPDRTSLQLARNVASGKECVPALLVLGAFIRYFNEFTIDPEKIYVLFMPITTGPCRTGQYAVFFDRILREKGFPNIALLKLNSDNSYSELGRGFTLMAWHAVCAGDAMKDLKSGMRVCLKNPEDGFAIADEYWKKMIEVFASGNLSRDLPKVIHEMSLKLRTLPLARDLTTVKKVLVVGEIYVRRDDFSVQSLIDTLTEWGIMARISGLSEWIHYLDFMREYELKLAYRKKPLWNKIVTRYLLKRALLRVEFWWKHKVQHKIEHAFQASGIFPAAPSNMMKIMARADEFTSTDFATEATLSPSVAAEAMEQGYSGIVIIAPFACLPGRLIESIYGPWAHERKYPVISLENDGNLYPPNIMSKINIFSFNVQSFNKQDTADKKPAEKN
ncbi:MAG: activase, partial [Candidatus Raymondbacteria bacterium RifOxyB12_full_50_8]